MFTPLVDILRCPNVHDETWLVASIDRAEERDVLEGTLGCPICMAEYPIRSGVVHFADVVPPVPPVPPVPMPSREQDAVRLAAALDLTEARMTALLEGPWGTLAPMVRGLTPAQLLLVNPPGDISSGDGISIVRALTAPVARGAVDAVAVGAGATDEMLASLVASLKGGGRMLGPIAVRVPDGLVELARDEEIWVAQVQSSGASMPVPITRGPRRPH